MELNGYSRALMGFDFADASALLAARRKFAEYLAENGVDQNQAESDADGLNHSWEFAVYHLPGLHDQKDHDPRRGGEMTFGDGNTPIKSSDVQRILSGIDTGKELELLRKTPITERGIPAIRTTQSRIRIDKIEASGKNKRLHVTLLDEKTKVNGGGFVLPTDIEYLRGRSFLLDTGKLGKTKFLSIKIQSQKKEHSDGKSFMLRHMPPWRGLMDTRPGSPHLKIFGKYAELKERRSYDCQWCGLHRYHLPGQHDQCAHSPTGECQPVESGKDVTGITTVKDRAFRGQPKALRNSVGKQETGAIGEALALRLTGAKKMNGKWNNFPIDLIKGNTVYEVKAGLVSNGADAQKWRLTIGEPGPKEKAWLRKASPAAKARWNDRKADMIVERKRKVVADLERRLGRKVRLKTLTFIIDPDRKIADMHEFDGVHPVIRWRSGQAASGYRRTVRYG